MGLGFFGSGAVDKSETENKEKVREFNNGSGTWIVGSSEKLEGELYSKNA